MKDKYECLSTLYSAVMYGGMFNVKNVCGVGCISAFKSFVLIMLTCDVLVLYLQY
jgi:hypothetical protein